MSVAAVCAKSELQMQLSEENAVGYLQRLGYLSADERAVAHELCGGVSNVVVRVSRPIEDDLVLKQVRKQLNVADPWFCSVERIWREVDVLRECERLLRNCPSNAPIAVEVPRFLFEDRENYVYAMSAAPTDHVVWKNELLSGNARLEIASACGILLGNLHAGSWHDDALARQFDDTQFFDDLRLDPYYRQIAIVHPELRPEIERLIASLRRERHCLVHGDFSPKNLLVHDNRLMLIDFEVGHYGDPAFDLGFFLAHLVLKAVYHSPRHEPFFDLIDAFWNSYQAAMTGVVPSSEYDSVVSRGMMNFAGCAMARLDGKSRIDYLSDTDQREKVRELCRQVLAGESWRWSEVRRLACRLLAAERD